jgi:hypothetical protein
MLVQPNGLLTLLTWLLDIDTAVGALIIWDVIVDLDISAAYQNQSMSPPIMIIITYQNTPTGITICPRPITGYFHVIYGKAGAVATTLAQQHTNGPCCTT